MAVITDAERKKQRNRELKSTTQKTKKRGLRRAKNGIAKDAKKN